MAAKRGCWVVRSLILLLKGGYRLRSALVVGKVSG
jgi:hypothetical protein